MVSVHVSEDTLARCELSSAKASSCGSPASRSPKRTARLPSHHNAPVDAVFVVFRVDFFDIGWSDNNECVIRMQTKFSYGKSLQNRVAKPIGRRKMLREDFCGLSTFFYISWLNSDYN